LPPLCSTALHRSHDLVIQGDSFQLRYEGQQLNGRVGQLQWRFAVSS
jgi:hypothetical protein